MFRSIIVGIVAVVILGTLFLKARSAAADNPPEKESKAAPKQSEKKADKRGEKKLPALAFVMKDIEGKKQDLRQYHGNVILMVNVASRCGLTPQYEQLQAVYRKYADRGFVIFGFPANNFMGQEPGSNDEIKQFCTSKFDVTFPLFAKVSVKGDDICPLYKYLTDKKADHKKGGDIEWNFGKFIIDRNGKVVDRFNPRVKPDDEKLIASLEKYLAEAIPEGSALAKQRKTEADKNKSVKDDEKTEEP